MKNHKNKNYLNIRFSIVSLFIATLTLSGCLDSGDPIQPEDQALVSFYHGAPDEASIDVFVDQTRVNSQSFSFSNTISYQRFRTGERDFKFTPRNASNSLLETSLTFEKNKVYSVFMANSDSDLNAILIEDKWEKPDSGEGMIRSINISPGLENAKFRIYNSENEIIHELPFEDASEFDSFESGKYTIDVISADTDQKLATAGNLNLQSGRVYTIVARGISHPVSNSPNKISIQVLTNYYY